MNSTDIGERFGEASRRTYDGTTIHFADPCSISLWVASSSPLTFSLTWQELLLTRRNATPPNVNLTAFRSLGERSNHGRNRRVGDETSIRLSNRAQAPNSL